MDIDDPTEKKIQRNDDTFSPDVLLNNNPSTSEQHIDSENEILQLQTIHETYPSVIKESLIIAFFDPSFFDPSFFIYTSKYSEICMPPDTPFFVETILNYQKRDLFLKVVYKRTTEF